MLTAKYYEKNNGYKYVLDTLKEGDAGVINLADGQRAYFSPN